MEKLRWVLIFSFGIFILIGSSCAPQPVEGYSIEQLQSTAEKLILETAQANPTETLPPLPTLRNTDTPIPSRNPTSAVGSTTTFAPTNTELAPPSPTPFAEVYISMDTNCRTGPSNHYDWKTLVKSGQTAIVVGASRDNFYWVIENPNGSGTCWLWKAYTTPIAPITRVPIFASPPTKTPTRTSTPTPFSSASFQFAQVKFCDGQQVLMVRVFNASRRILQSWRARLFNMPGKVLQVTEENNQFAHNLETCTLSINTLDYRQSGYLIIPFDSGLADDFFVEVEACNLEGAQRDCAADIIKFNYTFLTATPTFTPTPTDTATPTITLTLTPTK